MSRVAFVLDASVLAGHARLEPVSVAVGEILATATDSDVIVGIPAAAYLAACWELDEQQHDLLRQMITDVNRVVEILPLLGPDTDTAASLDVELRRQGLGHSIIETLRHGAALATLQPDKAGQMLADDSIVDLSQ